MVRRKRPGLYRARETSDRQSRPLIAGYAGMCERCACEIKPGQLIVYRTRNGIRGQVHALCDE